MEVYLPSKPTLLKGNSKDITRNMKVHYLQDVSYAFTLQLLNSYQKNTADFYKRLFRRGTLTFMA